MVLPVHIGIFEHAVNGIADRNRRKDIKLGVAKGTSKNVGLGKFWPDLEISEAFLICLEVSFSRVFLRLGVSNFFVESVEFFSV